MKKYRVYCTHNPQDFFEGSEPHELVETLDFDESVESCCFAIAKILELIDGGYKAIIFQKEGDRPG